VTRAQGEGATRRGSAARRLRHPAEPETIPGARATVRKPRGGSRGVLAVAPASVIHLSGAVQLGPPQVSFE
jgi:hypothetical protein